MSGEPLQQAAVSLQRTEETAKFDCQLCGKSFTTDRGRSRHLNFCRKKYAKSNEMTSSRSPSHASSILAEPTLTTSVGDTSHPNPETRQSPFIWGSHTKNDLCQIVNGAYEEIVFWRKNVFMLPSGAAGKAYVKETDRLVSAWNCDSADLQAISI